jgi:putative hydrolase of the HAD superfamily
MGDSPATMHAPRPAAPAALLLDALGTLVTLDPPAPLLRTALRDRFGVRVSEAEAEHALLAEIGFYRSRLDGGRDPASLAALRRRCAEVLRAALPAGTALAAVGTQAMAEALLASLRFRAFPDVAPALRDWRERGARLVVVSNWDVSLHEVLARLELAPLLDGILTSAEAGTRKPAPEIFERALSMAGVDAGAAVHVGDSLTEDVAGARAAGIEPVLVARGEDLPPSGVPVVASLAELRTLWP